MRGFSDYDKTESYSETTSRKLPAGAYEIRIIRAEERDDTLCILFDIAGGEFANYYIDKFNDEKRFDPEKAKYKGVYRMWYESPNNDDKRNEQNRRRMKTALERIKVSNNLDIDYTRKWDGAKLKDCRVGMIFRDEEYNYNGYQGFTARPYAIITLDSLKKGNFTLPAAKTLSGSSAANTGTFTNIEQTPLDDDLPF